MNEILQKRIVEAAKDYSDHNYVDEGVEVPAFIEGADFALKNQWISVEEALPPKEDNDSSITVLVHCQKGWCGIDYYRYKYGEWLNNGNSVTHWMSIPSLEGGEE
jgi:hypothetical protein